MNGPTRLGVVCTGEFSLSNLVVKPTVVFQALRVCLSHVMTNQFMIRKCFIKLFVRNFHKFQLVFHLECERNTQFLNKDIDCTMSTLVYLLGRIYLCFLPQQIPAAGAKACDACEQNWWAYLPRRGHVRLVTARKRACYCFSPDVISFPLHGVPLHCTWATH